METGATIWDYRIRRMEIAWELAQKIRSQVIRDEEHRKEVFRSALKDAWQIVEEVLPAGRSAR